MDKNTTEESIVMVEEEYSNQLHPTSPSYNNQVARLIRYELRVFSFLKIYYGIKHGNISQNCGIEDSMTLTAVSEDFHHWEHSDIWEYHFWKNRHLICNNISDTTTPRFSAQVIPPQFYPQVAQLWLHFSIQNHTKLCHSIIDVTNLRVIDCEPRVIITASYSARYLALSCVWVTPGSDSNQDAIANKLGHERLAFHYQYQMLLKMR
jgi:hypothetical protein